MKVRFSLLVLLAALVFAITFSAVGMKGKKSENERIAVSRRMRE